MGLSAFNRAREIRAHLNEQNEQEEQSRLEEQQQTDAVAAAAVHDMIMGIDSESPDFAKMVIGARTAHSALTTEQKELVDSGAELEAAEAALLAVLATVPPPATEPAQVGGDVAPPVETVPPTDGEVTPQPPATEPAPATGTVVPTAEPAPPTATPEKTKKQSGGKK